MRDTNGTWITLGAATALAMASLARSPRFRLVSGSGAAGPGPVVEPLVPPLPAPSPRGDALKPRGEWYWQKGQAWAKDAIENPKRAPKDPDEQQLDRALEMDTAEAYFRWTGHHFFRPAAWLQGRWVADYAASKADHPKDNLDRLFWQGARRYASAWLLTWDEEILSDYHDRAEWAHFQEWKKRHPRPAGSPARAASRKAELIRRVRKVAHSVVSERPEGGVSECSSWLPDGTASILCTNWARLMQRDLGGEVLGYFHEDNPTAELGEDEGGHDFLLVDGRYIVDGWALDVREVEPGVWDREDPKDAAAIRRLYGDPGAWRTVPG